MREEKNRNVERHKTLLRATLERIGRTIAYLSPDDRGIDFQYLKFDLKHSIYKRKQRCVRICKVDTVFIERKKKRTRIEVRKGQKSIARQFEHIAAAEN